jgi:hypothetical protein
VVHRTVATAMAALRTGTAEVAARPAIESPFTNPVMAGENEGLTSSEASGGLAAVAVRLRLEVILRRSGSAGLTVSATMPVNCRLDYMRLGSVMRSAAFSSSASNGSSSWRAINRASARVMRSSTISVSSLGVRLTPQVRQ